MLRKTILAVAAVAALGATALAPTGASAHGWKFGPRFGGGYPGYGFGPTYFAPPVNCYFVKKWSPFGFQFVKVCSTY
jgi:disulfide bond formation protein DsbB